MQDMKKEINKAKNIVQNKTKDSQKSDRPKTQNKMDPKWYHIWGKHISHTLTLHTHRIAHTLTLRTYIVHTLHTYIADNAHTQAHFFFSQNHRIIALIQGLLNL